MVVAECVIFFFEFNGEKFVFGYVEDDDIKLLKLLFKGLQERMDLRNVGKRNEFNVESKGNDKLIIEESFFVKVFIEKNFFQSCEDDDDLVSYDFREEDDRDLKFEVLKYLRDCIEGFLVLEDLLKMEVLLKNVEKFVCVEMDDLEDVCEELVKVLFYFQDRYFIDMFGELRYSVIVVVFIRCFEQIVCYLIEEFFVLNYNLQQRMDMLSFFVDVVQRFLILVEIIKIKEVLRRFLFL